MLFEQLCIFGLLMSIAFGASMDSLKKLIATRMKRPPQSKYDRPLNVQIGFYLESLGNFRETQMTFDTDMYMYMSWKDSALSHSGVQHVMVNDNDIRKQMWLPDLYFANAKTAQFHLVTVPNFSIFIAKDGTIAYSCRVTLTVACNLDLKNYPMDVQNCQIRILSYAYIAAVVNVTWFKESAIRYNSEINLPEYEIISITPGYCNGTYRYAVMANSHRVDQFSCLVANIRLQRNIGYTLVQSYFPTGLIVIISWVSFWIDRSAVPARVTLSFSTLLSLTTLGNGVRYGLPQVSYAKAIDFWFGACMLFVFCSLLEFAVVNSYMRHSERNDRLSEKYLQRREGDSKERNGNKTDARGVGKPGSDPHAGRVLMESPGQVSDINFAEHYAQVNPLDKLLKDKMFFRGILVVTNRRYKPRNRSKQVTQYVFWYRAHPIGYQRIIKKDDTFIDRLLEFSMKRSVFLSIERSSCPASIRGLHFRSTKPADTRFPLRSSYGTSPIGPTT